MLLAGLCCVLVVVTAEMVFQPVSRRCMFSLVMQNKRHYSIAERRNLAMDGICTVCRGKIIQPLSDAAQMHVFSSLLLKWGVYYTICCQVFLIEIRSVPVQNIHTGS